MCEVDLFAISVALVDRQFGFGRSTFLWSARAEQDNEQSDKNEQNKFVVFHESFLFITVEFDLFIWSMRQSSTQNSTTGFSALAASRSEEHTSELQHMSISYAVFCLKKKKK